MERVKRQLRETRDKRLVCPTCLIMVQALLRERRGLRRPPGQESWDPVKVIEKELQEAVEMSCPSCIATFQELVVKCGSTAFRKTVNVRSAVFSNQHGGVSIGTVGTLMGRSIIIFFSLTLRSDRGNT
jgi:hypothetical protein